MKKISILLLILLIKIQVFAQIKTDYNPLFNGKNLEGWIMPGEAPGFKVENGMLKAIPPDGSDLFTEEQFGNYVLRFEYLLSEVGNSGVLIRCNSENPWDTGVEVQLLAPWTPYRDDLHCTGSLYGHVAVTNRPDETTGIWHEMEIKCDRKMITVSVDGKMTTHVNIDTVKSMQDKYLHGAIGFQSNHSREGEFAYFRNISVYHLDEYPEYVAKGFGDQDVRVRKQAWHAAGNLGASMINQLVVLLEDDNVMVQAGAKQVLFEIVARSTEPGNPTAENSQIVNNLRKNYKTLQSEAANAYLQWLEELAQAGKNKQHFDSH